jgi:DNA gyrase subunit A
MGIAVGLACNICSFNLAEICDGTIALLKNPNTSLEKMMSLIKAPDFQGGAQLIYNRAQMEQVFLNGTGSVRLRSRYQYDKEANCIDILQIPYSSSIESIMKKIGTMVKEGKMKDITDFRNDIDLHGFKLSLDLRRGADPDKVMRKLFRETDLENTFACNFNVLVDGSPKQLGVIDILKEWIRFRTGCLTRELAFDLEKKRTKQELLLGLGQILLDIDKAISIIRHTEKDEDVVPNLMKGFDLTRMQAEYVADIKLRNINKEYIAHRIEELEDLQQAIADIEEILGDELKLRAKIADELKEIKQKYGKPRKTLIIYEDDLESAEEEEEEIENYNVRLVLTHDGYFKKITAQSLRGNDEQKLKEGDYVTYTEDTDNLGTMFFLTNKAQVYRVPVSEFDVCKASQMGDFIPAKIKKFEDGELPILGRCLKSYENGHFLAFIFENGKGVRVPMSCYVSKTRRKKITGACSTVSKPIGAFYEKDKTTLQIFIRSDNGKGALIKSSLIPEKATRTAAGVQLLQLTRKAKVDFATDYMECLGEDAQKCRKLVVPTTGVSLAQLTFKFD